MLPPPTGLGRHRRGARGRAPAAASELGEASRRGASGSARRCSSRPGARRVDHLEDVARSRPRRRSRGRAPTGRRARAGSNSRSSRTLAGRGGVRAPARAGRRRSASSIASTRSRRAKSAGRRTGGRGRPSRRRGARASARARGVGGVADVPRRRCPALSTRISSSRPGLGDAVAHHRLARSASGRCCPGRRRRSGPAARLLRLGGGLLAASSRVRSSSRSSRLAVLGAPAREQQVADADDRERADDRADQRGRRGSSAPPRRGSARRRGRRCRCRARSRASTGWAGRARRPRRSSQPRAFHERRRREGEGEDHERQEGEDEAVEQARCRCRRCQAAVHLVADPVRPPARQRRAADEVERPRSPTSTPPQISSAPPERRPRGLGRRGSGAVAVLAHPASLSAAARFAIGRPGAARLS